MRARSLLIPGLLLPLVAVAWWLWRETAAPSPVGAPEVGSAPAVAAPAPPASRTATRTGVATPSPAASAPAPASRPRPPAPEDPRILLRATLVDGAGVALARQYVDFQLQLADSEESFSLQQTDAEGVYVWSVGSPGALVRPVRHARFTLRPWTADALGALVSIERVLTTGTNDLGVVALRPPTAVVGGVVVDEHGVPHADAAVDLWALAQPPEAGSDRTADGRMWAMPWPPIRSRCDASGAFVVRGDWPGDDVALLARPQDSPAGSLVAARRGVMDLRLVVARGASVAGRLVMDDPAAADQFLVRALVRGAAGEAECGQAAPRKDGSFLQTRLAPGVVAVTVARQHTQVHRVEDVQLVAGQVNRDPRLAALDVRAGDRAITVQVAMPDRKPMWGAEVIASRGGVRVGAERTGRDGVARLVVPQLPVDLLVWDPQVFGPVVCRGVSLRGVTGDQSVVLRPGPVVRLTVTGADAVPEGLRLLPELVPTAGTAADGVTPVAELFPRFGLIMGYAPRAPGEAFRVPFAATYDVRFGLKSSTNRLVHLDHHAQIVVGDGEAEQVFEVQVPAASIARAADILRQQGG